METARIAASLPGWFKSDPHANPAVISTRIRLARNIGNRPFPHKASLIERKAIFDEVSEALRGVVGDGEWSPRFNLVNIMELDPLHQQLLLERKMVTSELVDGDGDRGVVYDESGFCSILINEEDHLRIQGIDAGLQVEQIWQRLSKLDDTIGEKVRFVFDDRRGFLTTYPSNCGCGLQVSFLLHLPGLVLTKTLDQVLTGASHMGFAVKSFLGEQSEVVGNLFQLANRASVGVSEQGFLSEARTIIEKILSLESAARLRIIADAHDEIIDKIYRSIGILNFAHTLSIPEVLNLSSAIRFGIEHDILTGMEITALNTMILCCFPGHMELLLKQEMETERERCLIRPRIVRECIADLRIKR